MLRMLSIILLASFHFHCSPSSSDAGKRDAGSPTVGTPATSFVHFFSVAWGCIQVEVARLEAAQYTIRDFTPAAGACPTTVPVLTAVSKPLLQCPVVIGPASIPATYILFDKRTLDGQTVRDLQAEGFTEENFCPAVSQRAFN